ncbi:unnamed protein product [Cuscuta epithymum]|uniref:Uncharacterized protein n=1 Tax=Cuscuta epithymum TaxID=186058 RepID=A0AAV0E428_9ASTE|nr:unnamed protein product [Cuscuta epithymum]
MDSYIKVKRVFTIPQTSCFFFTFAAQLTKGNNQSFKDSNRPLKFEESCLELAYKKVLRISVEQGSFGSSNVNALSLLVQPFIKSVLMQFFIPKSSKTVRHRASRE